MTRPCLAQPQPESRGPRSQGQLEHRAPRLPRVGHRDKPKQGALWPWQGR